MISIWLIIKWGQKSKNPKIPRTSNKSKSNPWTKDTGNPRKIPCQIPMPLKIFTTTNLHNVLKILVKFFTNKNNQNWKLKTKKKSPYHCHSRSWVPPLGQGYKLNNILALCGCHSILLLPIGLHFGVSIINIPGFVLQGCYVVCKLVRITQKMKGGLINI